jgi:proteic killer suppression protein
MSGMIASFADARTAALFRREHVKRMDLRLQHMALRKLVMLDAATAVQDLRTPPGNRLEALKGGREGQYSFRVDDQYRIVFTWKDARAHNVALVDYH